MSRMNNWTGVSAVALLAAAGLVAAPAANAVPATSALASSVVYAAETTPPAPKFAKMSVNKGPARAETKVTISGTNFVTTSGATTVKVGSTTLTEGVTVSATSIGFTMPALAAGGTAKQTISVTSGTVTKDFAFTYVVPKVTFTFDKTKLKPTPGGTVLELTPNGDTKITDTFAVKNAAGTVMPADTTADATAPALGKVLVKDGKLLVGVAARATTDEKGTSFTVYNDWNAKGQTFKITWDKSIPTVKIDKTASDKTLNQDGGKVVFDVSKYTATESVAEVYAGETKLTKADKVADVDAAGEYFYDATTKKLTLLTPANLTPKTTVDITIKTTWGDSTKAVKIKVVDPVPSIKAVNKVETKAFTPDGGILTLGGKNLEWLDAGDSKGLKVSNSTTAIKKIDKPADADAEKAAAAGSWWYTGANTKDPGEIKFVVPARAEANKTDKSFTMTAVNKWGTESNALKVNWNEPKTTLKAKKGNKLELNPTDGGTLVLEGDKTNLEYVSTLKLGDTDLTNQATVSEESPLAAGKWNYNATAKALTINAPGNSGAVATVNLTATNKWGNEIKGLKVKYVAPKMGSVTATLPSNPTSLATGGEVVTLKGTDVKYAKTVMIGTTAHDVKASGTEGAVAVVDGDDVKVTMPAVPATEWTAGAPSKVVKIQVINEWGAKSNVLNYTYKAPTVPTLTATPLTSDSSADVTVTISAASAFTEGAKVQVDGKDVTATANEDKKSFTIVMAKLDPVAAKTSKIEVVNAYGLKSTAMTFTYTK